MLSLASEVKAWKHNRFGLNWFYAALLEYLIKDTEVGIRKFLFQFN